MIDLIVAINRKMRFVVLDSGATLPIQTMINADGDETDDPDECIFAIVPHPCGSWICCDLREYEDVKSH
jgi:hypothetical protein